MKSDRDRYPRLEDLHFQFQPIESAPDGVVRWHEALVRWRLRDGTVRGPLDVLPYWLARARSETFTHFTVTRAAEALRASPGARVSINLSPGQVAQPAAVEALRRLQPELKTRLVVELTEQRIRNLDAYWQGLERVREHVALVLLDDVTFDDLDRRFRQGEPIDGVKLDRSLLPALLGGSDHDRARRLVDAALERFSVVVAEGVEDPSARQALAELGVTHLQGFGLGTPSPAIRGAGAAAPPILGEPSRPGRPEPGRATPDWLSHDG